MVVVMPIVSVNLLTMPQLTLLQLNRYFSAVKLPRFALRG